MFRKRTHQSSGSGRRHARACMACRTRRIRCNRAKPCTNCMLRGIDCVSVEAAVASSSSSSSTSTPGVSTSRSLSRSASASVQKSLTQGGPIKPGFHRFVRALEDILVGYPNPQTPEYWWGCVIPAAHYSGALMDAILAKGIVNSMTKDQLLRAGLPKYAIEHYVQSLCQPVTDLNDFPILLMITNLYIEIEKLLSHYQNLDSLIRSSITILYTNKDLLWNRYLGHQLFLCTLYQFMNLAIGGPVDSMAIPMYQWEEILRFALKSALKLRVSGLALAEIRLFDLIWRLSRSDMDVSTISWKIVTWEHALAQHQQRLAPGSKDAEWAQTLMVRFSISKIFWNAFQWHFYSNEHCLNILRTTLEYNHHRFVKFCQLKASSKESQSPFFAILLYGDLLARMVYITWYARDKEMCRRSIGAFSSFKSMIAYHDDVVSYLEALVDTEFGTFTELEVGYFGADIPYLLKYWQICRLTDRLATHGFARVMEFMRPSLTVVNL